MRAVLLLMLSASAAATPTIPQQRRHGAPSAQLEVHDAAVPDDLVLRDVTIDVVMPTFVEDREPPSHAAVQTTYTFDNGSSEPITLPLRFVAIDANAPRARANGAYIEVRHVLDARVRERMLEALATALCERPMPGVAEKHPRHEGCVAGQLRRLQGARAPERDVVLFEVTFRPGRNQLEIAHEQLLDVVEMRRSVFEPPGFRIRGAHAWLEHSIAPINDWRHHEDFRFAVNVSAPTMHLSSWWSPSGDERRPLIRTRPALAELDDVAQAHHADTFHALPVDVLSVLVVLPDG